MIKLEDYRIIDFESLLKKEAYAERQTSSWLSYLKSLGDFRAVKSSFETNVQELRDTDRLKQILNQKNERHVDQATFKLFWHSKDSKINFDTPLALKKLGRLKPIIVDKSTMQMQDAIFQSAKINAKGSHDKIKDLDSLKKELLIILNIVGQAAVKNLKRSLDYYNLVDRIERALFHQALFEKYTTFYSENPPKSASNQLPISKAIIENETEELEQISRALQSDSKYNEYLKIRESLRNAVGKSKLKLQSHSIDKPEIISALLSGMDILIDHYEYFAQDDRPNRYLDEDKFVRNYSDLILRHIAQPSVSPRFLTQFNFPGKEKENNVFMRLKKNQCVAVASVFLLLGVGGVPHLNRTSDEQYSDLIMSWARKSFDW